MFINYKALNTLKTLTHDDCRLPHASIEVFNQYHPGLDPIMGMLTVSPS